MPPERSGFAGNWQASSGAKLSGVSKRACAQCANILLCRLPAGSTQVDCKKRAGNGFLRQMAASIRKGGNRTRLMVHRFYLLFRININDFLFFLVIFVFFFDVVKIGKSAGVFGVEVILFSLLRFLVKKNS